MNAAVGIILALLVIASSVFVTVALTRQHQLARELKRLAAATSAARETVSEASVGYTCMVEPCDVELDGEHEGEPFDVVQRRIRPGHISCPSGDLVNGDLHVVLPTPSTSATNWPRQALHVALLATLATACGPSIILIEDSGDGDLPSDGDTDEPGDGDGDQPADMPAGCEPGEFGCECDADGACAGELVCDEGVCGEVDPFELFTECDDDGRCWVRREWWPSWAQMSDPAGIQAGIDGNTLTASESIDGFACYEYGEPTATVCVLMLDGIELHARPLAELQIVGDSACSGDGPWSSSFSSAFWCYGRFGQLGVALRDI